jgi:hypothetical protein
LDVVGLDAQLGDQLATVVGEDVVAVVSGAKGVARKQPFA